MKNRILLTIFIIFISLSSCKKEDDIFTPINPSNIAATNTDTTINNNGSEGPNILEYSPDESLTTNSDVTILPPINTFRGAGKNYNVKSAEFSVNCSELTNQHFDTSYSYVTTNWTGQQIVSVPGYHNGIGNGVVQFSQFHSNGYPITNGVEGYFYSTVYPMNGNATPSHSYNFTEMWHPWNIVSYSYIPGVITLNLVSHPCNGSDLFWSSTMDVTEYSDGTIALSIDQGPYNFAGITWSSHLKVLLEED